MSTTQSNAAPKSYDTAPRPTVAKQNQYGTWFVEFPNNGLHYSTFYWFAYDEDDVPDGVDPEAHNERSAKLTAAALRGEQVANPPRPTYLTSGHWYDGY